MFVRKVKQLTLIFNYSPVQYSDMSGMREYQKVPNYYGDAYRQMPPSRENWDSVQGKNLKLYKKRIYN